MTTSGLWLAIFCLVMYSAIMFGVSFTEPATPIGDWLLRILGVAGLVGAVWMYVTWLA